MNLFRRWLQLFRDYPPSRTETALAVVQVVLWIVWWRYS